MRTLARWHIWLGWLVGLPLLLWTLSGFFMVLKPIEEVRGEDLRIERPVLPVRVAINDGRTATMIREGRIFNQRGRSILLATFTDGSVARLDLESENQRRLPPVDAGEARSIVAAQIRGGNAVTGLHLFEADHAPLDLRKPVAAWQVTLADGTHVYVGRYTGEIEAIRTRWWRAFDFMWGLHILDLETREDTHHFFLVVFAGLALVGTVMGCTLMFRKRRRQR